MMTQNPIKTALCSFGMSGLVFHAPFIEVNKNFQLYGVLERTKNEAQKKYPSIKIFRNLESLLLDENIELVVVNTPNITHFDFVKKTINAGKHVLVEKPFTVSALEAKELIDLAKEKNVMLAVYQNRRYDSDFKTVKKVVKEQLLGDLVDVEIHFDRFAPDLSYKKHKENPTEGVGSLYDLGSHIIDQALQLFGMPLAIFADLDIYRPNSKVTDYFDLKLYYNSFKVSLKSSYFVREPLAAYIFHGKKGSFVKSRSDVQEANLINGNLPNEKDWGIEPVTEEGLLHTEINGEIIREQIPSLTGNYMEFYDGVYQAIRNKKSVPVSGEEAMLVIKIIEAAIKSNNEKKVIEL